MRRALTIDCAGEALAATLDDAPGATGLLIVSGGNEIRCGAHRGMAMLAADVAAAGYPVLRFDRRGIGDSEGSNTGFTGSRDDIAAALAGFRAACPAVTRVVAFGNCDAAAALLLHQPLATDALVLANIWTIETSDDADGDGASPPLPSASAIRSRYWQRLTDPASVKRLLRGDIDLAKLARGIGAMLRPAPPPSDTSLAGRIGDALAATAQPATILCAVRDRTAAAFLDHWHCAAFAAARANPHLDLVRLDSASHSFAGDDAAWLRERIIAALDRADRDG